MHTIVIPFEEFEKAVMHHMCGKETRLNEILREQYRRAEITSREFTGAGFFTELKVPDDAPRVTDPKIYSYGSTLATINNNIVNF